MIEMVVAKSGKLCTTDEVLDQISDCVSAKEYCELVLHLNALPVAAGSLRRELKNWACGHPDPFVKSIGDWM